MKKFDNVWLIDDDPVSNLIGKEFLRRENFYHFIRDFIDPVEAWNEIATLAATDLKRLPDVLFLDLNMPDLDGWELLDRIATLPELAQVRMKIVLLTSSIDKKDMAKAKENDLIRGYIAKPLTPGQLHNLWVHLEGNTRMVA